VVEANAKLTEKMTQIVKLINEQHKKIFAYSTDLFGHCVGEEEEESEYFGATIYRATELVKNHFRTEEKLMLATKFDVFEFVNHKKEHDEFVSGVVGDIKNYEETGEVNLLMFASYVKWWVLRHIKYYDKKYVGFFNKLTEGYDIDKMRV
jgi:hemerythrin-like metal-binding protein